MIIRHCFGLVSLASLLCSSASFAAQESNLLLDQQFKAHDLRGEALIQVVYSPTNDSFITAASDGTLKWWSAPASIKSEFSPPSKPMLFNARFAPDGRSVIAAAYNGIATQWDVSIQQSRQYRPHLSGVTDAEILPGLAGVITSSDDGSIRFWSSQGTLLHRVQRPGVSRHMALAGRRGLVAVTQDIGEVTLLNNEGDLLQIFPTQQGRLNDVIFSPNEQQLVTGGFDGTIKIWDVSDPSKPIRLLHTIAAVDGSGWIEGLALNNRGQLASASEDGVVRLWSLTGDLLASKRLSDSHLMSVTFSPDGRRLLVAAQDGTVSALRVD